MKSTTSSEHLRLAATLARRFAFGLDWRELYAEAWQALARAAELYDPERGPWSPYAVRHVRARLLDVRRKLRQTVSAPRDVVVSVASLSASLGDSDSTLEDMIADDAAVCPEAETSRAAELRTFAGILAELPDEARTVVLARADNVSRCAIAAEHGQSAEWVRATEQRCMRQLEQRLRQAS